MMDNEKFDEKVSELLEKEEVMFQSVEKNKAKAEGLLEDEDKMESFLKRMEKKLVKIPFAGKYLTDVPVLIELIRAYMRKEYTKVPMVSILAIISALIYFVNPFDLIPDIIPVIGYTDDTAVILFVLKMVHKDLKDYRVWRENDQA
ncbi:MAG: YkvA family protein [Mobilitalea sp.]